MTPNHWIRCAGLALLVGCGPGASSEPVEEPGVLTHERFTEVFVALREASREAASPDEFESRKLDVLDRYGVTPEDLTAFARANAGDIPEMARLWSAIDSQLIRTDTTRAGE